MSYLLYLDICVCLLSRIRVNPHSKWTSQVTRYVMINEVKMQKNAFSKIKKSKNNEVNIFCSIWNAWISFFRGGGLLFFTLDFWEQFHIIIHDNSWQWFLESLGIVTKPGRASEQNPWPSGSPELILIHVDNPRPHSEWETICCYKGLLALPILAPCSSSSQTRRRAAAGQWASEGQGRLGPCWLPCTSMKTAFYSFHMVYCSYITNISFDPWPPLLQMELLWGNLIGRRDDRLGLQGKWRSCFWKELEGVPAARPVLEWGRVTHWPRFCLSLPVQVWTGRVVTEEKHNQGPQCSSVPSVHPSHQGLFPNSSN